MSHEIAATGGSLQAERLTIIENRIRDNMNRAAESLIDVGRCLNQAKDEHLVVHGQWQEWVQRNTGMTLRNAQRVMQVAREVPSASALAHLEFTKVQALLALPASEREEFAESIDAEDMSVRELQAAIKAKHAAEKDAENERKRYKELEASVPQLAEQQAQQYIGEIEAAAADKIAAKDAELARMQAVTQGKEQELDDLRQQLSAANQAQNGVGHSDVQRMQAEIADMEAELERRAKAEEDAKRQLLSLRSQMARGTVSGQSTDTLTPDELGAATRAFIGRAAVLPHMPGKLAAMTESERGAYRQYIDVLSDWCESSRAALDTIEAGVIDG
ncbi:MAG: DUF3102 domain-containing protein [Eubacteriales bacterium]|nr:DUF3102 domain-containing protein [Eubacteriales bacterium]